MAKELKKNNMGRNTSLKGIIQSKRTRKSPLRFGWRGGWGGGLQDYIAGNTLQSSVQTSAPAGNTGVGSYVSIGSGGGRGFRGLQDLISGNTLQ